MSMTVGISHEHSLVELKSVGVARNFSDVGRLDHAGGVCFAPFELGL